MKMDLIEKQGLISRLENLRDYFNNNGLQMAKFTINQAIQTLSEPTLDKQQMIDFGYACLGEVESELGDLIYIKVPEDVYKDTFEL